MDVQINPLINTTRSKYARNGSRTMRLRSNNNNNNRKTYFGSCTRHTTKMYDNERYDKRKIWNNTYRNKRSFASLNTNSNKENIPIVQPRKKRKKNKNWGNKKKQTNEYRLQPEIIPRDHTKKK
eukprot:471807_1